MSKFIIEGGVQLNGEVQISGSKNAALPILCASLLTKEKVVLNNVPNISDIRSMIEILRSMGAEITFKDSVLTVVAENIEAKNMSEELIKQMRASILIVGALIARNHEIKMGFPGGCVLGKRSLDAHTHAFTELGGAVLDSENGFHIKAGKLVGKKIVLPESSVTATENAIMGAVLAEGKTEIRLAAAEPHVADLCHFLNSMGAKITNIGTSTIKIDGVTELHGTEYTITGDYLEAGTYAIAAVATGGDVLIKGIQTDQLDSFWYKFREMGVDFELTENSVHILKTEKIKPVKIRTSVHPGFPTDLQAPFSVLLTQAEGISKIFETLFDGRLNYLFEVEKMGARIELLNPHQALIIGPTQLKALPISSPDIRAGAAMVIVALMAKGKTEITNIKYIDRGYENLHGKMKALGAKIERISEA